MDFPTANEMITISSAFDGWIEVKQKVAECIRHNAEVGWNNCSIHWKLWRKLKGKQQAQFKTFLREQGYEVQESPGTDYPILIYWRPSIGNSNSTIHLHEQETAIEDSGSEAIGRSNLSGTPNAEVSST